MKIQTFAYISALSVDGQELPIADQQTIELEFSAIDTGGGFKDPILDFSIPLDDMELHSSNPQQISLELRNPKDKDHSVSFSCQGDIAVSDQQMNARLKEEQLSRELIGFVLKLLR
ncbi:hypothetical protein LX73_2282 [Fodinibius salinus]|uniref:Uncharacterized protein n=1 Tax=Fodinibius salinus TaxID=860790 RepID=A0A5D3YF53_9BACT|nr:hypothetical protein [Fodinibius salinus]TYP92036.1 hypothetical protein LX73_2282 [Fodinibius salinus]